MMFGKLFFNTWRKGGSEKETKGGGAFLLSSVLLSSLLLSSLLLSSFLRFHDYHVSVTQMQFNPVEKSYEVSIRIFTDDLEKALMRQNGGKATTLKDGDKNDALVENYIRKTFLLSDSQKQSVRFRYVGKEQEADATWVYLEIPAPANLSGYSLKHVVLMEIFDDQVNMTNLKTGPDRRTFMFKKGDTIHSL